MAYQILASSNSNRSGATALNGSTRTGPLYVFVDPQTNIVSVDFSLDGVYQHGESVGPFDYMGTAGDGTAYPFDLSTLSGGSHTISAVVKYTTTSRKKTVQSQTTLTAIFTAATATPAPAPTPVPTGSVLPKLGLYCGGGNVTGMQQFEAWFTRNVPWVLDFCDGTSWSTIGSPGWVLDRWGTTGKKLVIGLPMMPAGVSLAQVANGAGDTAFSSFAQVLAGRGITAPVVRVGWEFNGNWFPWSVTDATAGDFRAAFQRIVNNVRAKIPGAKFTWNPTLGRMYVNPDLAYPGDAYVDYIGLDHYDGGTTAHPNFSERWNWYATQPYGLNWHRDFALAHGKPMTFDEWGLWAPSWSGGGGGDNPAFIQAMHDWLANNNVAYANFWQNPGDPMIFASGAYPDSASAFKQTMT